MDKPTDHDNAANQMEYDANTVAAFLLEEHDDDVLLCIEKAARMVELSGGACFWSLVHQLLMDRAETWRVKVE